MADLLDQINAKQPQQGTGGGDLLDQMYEQQQGGGKSLGGFLSNVGTSAVNFAGDVASAITHPLETVRTIGAIPVGLAEKAGVPVPAPGPGEIDAAKQLDAILGHFKDRYGSFESAKDALYQDPVGVLSDISALAGGAGAAADLSKLGKVAKVAGTISEFTDPLRLTGKVAGVTGLPVKAAEAAKDTLVRGALRAGFNVNTPAETVINAVESMKSNRFPFSEAGLDKISKAIQRLQLEKTAETVGAASSGVTIDPASVESRLNEVLNRRQLQVNPDPDIRQIEKVRRTFQARTGQQPIPADEAELLKEGTYATNKYEPQEHVAATSEAEKALARGLKEELEAKIPELTALNAKQAKFLDLQGVLEKAVNKYRNQGGFWGTVPRALISQAGLGVGGAAGLATHDPVAGVAAAAMQAILSDPQVKIRLANAIDMAQRSNPGKWTKPANAIRMINAYSDSFGKLPE